MPHFVYCLVNFAYQIYTKLLQCSIEVCRSDVCSEAVERRKLLLEVRDDSVDTGLVRGHGFVFMHDKIPLVFSLS